MNIIVGGTKGLGSEIANLLQSEGQETYVTGRSYDKDLHGEGRVLDLSSDEDVEAFTRFINEESAAIEGFFWVAGYGYLGDFAGQTDVQRMADVNFANILQIAQAAWRKMINSGQAGKFVVVSSTTGVKPRKDEAVYAATKHAQVGFARSLGLESERLGAKIKVALFLPGGMQTAFWEGNEPEIFNEFNDPAKVAKKICDSIAAQNDHFYEETIERGSL